MREHLPILQVVVPMMAAPLCLLVRHRFAVRALAVLVPWATLAIAGSLLARVRAEGPLSYALGGWVAPLGIEYRVDLLNGYVLVIVTAIAAVVLPFLPSHAGASFARGREHLFYAAFLLCLAGLLGMTITGDAFNIFVFLEISSLASYSLIALGSDRRALRAAYSYLILGTIGGTFILLGVGLMYQMTGTLNLQELRVYLPELLATRTVRVSFAFLFVGVSIKLALFPLHQWLPNAYTHAPAAVSSFLAATATKVSYYLLVRIVFGLFGAAFVFGTLRLDLLLVPLSLVAMFSGSLAAIYQTNVKRLLAYSSIAQIGTMTLGLAFANVTGLVGGLTHLFNHALMKGALFLTVASIGYRIGSAQVDDYRGLGKRMPLTMATFVIGGLALVGVPGTVGFISKWYLVLGALEDGRPLVAFLVVLSSLLALIYVWRVVEIAYFAPAPAGAHKIREVPLAMLIPTWVLTAAILYFGFDTDLTVGIATAAAEQLFQHAP